MDEDRLLEFALNFDGKPVGIYGTGTGALKVANALGILNKDVKYFFETSPKKEFFLDRPVLKATESNFKRVDAIIVASSYISEIKKIVESSNVKYIYYPFNEGWVRVDEKYEQGASIGRRTYNVIDTLDYVENLESIGAFTSINKRAAIGGKNHPLNLVSTHPVFYKNTVNESFIKENKSIDEFNAKIKIGNDVWIGTNAVILPGVEIGDGAVIGAGAIVTKDIPPYAIAIGVPAKVIKYRFSEEIIAGMLKIKWWDWSDEKIKENIDYFYDPEKFVEKFIEEIVTANSN